MMVCHHIENLAAGLWREKIATEGKTMKTDYAPEVMQAIKDMPVAFATERERDDYIIRHANEFYCQYKTHKTDIKATFDNIDDARKCAVMCTLIGGKSGTLRTVGVQVVAILGDRKAVVETHWPDIKHTEAAIAKNKNNGVHIIQSD